VADALVDSIWLGPLLWMGLYTSDYFLTIACARLYQAQNKIVFEGSYEITPLFQADVNALRMVSPRFVFSLLASTGYLILVRNIAGPSNGSFGFYPLVLGTMILTEATVHTRHLRNWYLFSRGIGLVKGRMEYPRGILLRSSALELIVFAGLYSGLFVVTESSFVLGGAIACVALSINHYLLARRHDASSDIKQSAPGSPGATPPRENV
jgi:hypothetical protein